MSKYQRITLLEREEISRQIASRISKQQIARNLDRSPSTISREIQRNVVNQIFYRACFAQQYCHKMRHQLRKNHKLANNRPLRKKILYYLHKKWSPEQIAKRLKFLYPNDIQMHISHETIYSYIYVQPKGTFRCRLISYLRRSRKYRRKKTKDRSKLGGIQDYFSIEERPEEVKDRTVPGHWEGDLMIGRRNMSAIGTLVERTTRMTFIVKLNSQDAINVRKAFANEFRHLPKGLKKTLTYDQGGEMAQHKIFTRDTNIIVYFAHPHSPWERGTNENTNSLLRQYFPQGTDFSKISKLKLKNVQDELNDRPRKTLGWHTPHEKFSELLR